MYLPVLSVSVLLLAGAMVDPGGTLEEKYQSLKEAESKKDAVLVKKLAGETCALAREAASEPAPESAQDKDLWQQRVKYARDIELYTEYSLFATAMQAQPAVTIDLLATLEQQNAKSKYLDDAYGRYFLALHQTGAAARITTVAEKALASFPNNEDLLMVLADAALNRRNTDAALRYSERLISTLATHGKPEMLSAADWERKRAAAKGRAHWIAGLIHAERTQYFEADKDLRAALPYLKGNEAMLGPALFQLGVANYQLGAAARNRAQILEGAKFSEQAAAIKGAHAQQAWRNAQAMKTEAAKVR